MTFDLKSFQAGQKAITRSGRKVTFIGICDDCLIESMLIVHVENDMSVDGYYINGKYTLTESSWDLVDMVEEEMAEDGIRSGAVQEGAVG